MKGKWICFMICLGLAGIPAVSVQAGNVNASEQSLISAVSQSFYYNGATYVVKDSYIQEGTSKLSADDVDLTASQAEGYISKFRDSYQELVEDGYCSKISDVSEDSVAATAVPDHSKKVSQENSLFLETVFGGTDTDSSEDGTDSQGDSKGSGSSKKSQSSNSKSKTSQTEQTQEVATAQPSQEESWGEEADLGKVLTFDDEDRSHAKENKVTISAGGGSFEMSDSQEQTDTGNQSTTSKSKSGKDSSSGEDGSGKQAKTTSKTSTALSGNLLSSILKFQWWSVIFGVALGLTVISMAVAGWYIYKFKHRKHKKRKLRKWIAVAMGTCSGIWTFFLLLMLTLYFGVYNNSAIQRQLMESDYFLGVTQMTRELAQDQLQEAGYSRDIAEEVFTLSSVYIEEKQYIESILKGKEDSEISTERIQDTLNTEVSGQDDASNKAIIADLEDTYVSMLQFPMASIIRESRNTFMKWFYGVMITGVILIIALFVMTYEIYDYLHKSARVYSVAMFVSSLLVTGAAFALKMLHVTDKVTANPVYYQQFLQKYLAWDINVAFYVGCIGILASAGLVIWKRYLHMIYAE